MAKQTVVIQKPKQVRTVNPTTKPPTKPIK